MCRGPGVEVRVAGVGPRPLSPLHRRGATRRHHPYLLIDQVVTTGVYRSSVVRRPERHPGVPDGRRDS